MTPSILAVNFGLSFTALAALCLSINRHHSEVFGWKAGAARVRWLRALGWAGIALSLAAAGLREGWDFGPVQWLGALTGAGLVLVLLVSYRPRAVYPAALVALAASAFGAMLM